VKRDYELASMDLKNRWGRRVEVEGCFMPKASMEPGLEVADLIAHTAGRQRRRGLAGKPGHTKEFQQTYWHSLIPPEFMAVSTIFFGHDPEFWQTVPQAPTPSHDALATVIDAPAKVRFAPDSPLEGDGFEPSVPQRNDPFWLPPFGPAIRLPQQKPALSCRGPMVRIHLPPAASQKQTVPALGFDGAADCLW
jgi:hypothetical protein